MNATENVATWDREESHRRVANAAAEYAHRLLFHRHRGVLDAGDKFILFGNDGYHPDCRSKDEVDTLRAMLESHGWDDVAFGTNDEEEPYSWALVVFNYARRIVDIDAWNDKVWKAWELARKEVTV